MSEEDLFYDDAASNETDCTYLGTEQVEVKIYLIGVFATFIAILSIMFNTFFTLVFIRNRNIRRSSVFYFGIIAVIDIIMAINYLAVMSLPVYMDYYHYLPIYHLFLSYFRLVLTESNCAMFASMLMIVLATIERLLRTFEGKLIRKARRFLEKHRPSVSCGCILVAIAYKACVYWEIGVKWKPMCEEGWGQYEIVAGPLTHNVNYRFWWMFVTRNTVDRLLPFCFLVLVNYLIIKALKKEFKRQDKFFENKVMNGNMNGMSVKTNRTNLRDATRALISMVSMYLMSQTLQVILTVWETFDRDSLEDLDIWYSYLNDAVSIMTLLSSCLRFPVYCICNRQINTASTTTLHGLISMCTRNEKKTKSYEPVASGQLSTAMSEVITGAVYNEKLQEWQL